MTDLAKHMKSMRQHKQSDTKLLEHLSKDILWTLGSLSPLVVGSENVGYTKRDDDLQFTRWTWL